MKIRSTLIIKLALLLTPFSIAPLHAENTVSPDLAAIPNGKLWKGDLSAVIISKKDGSPAVEFTGAQEKECIIWLEGFSFSSGVIEFDVKGTSAPPQGSFVGVAFRVESATTYDAIYFRPFNYRAAEAANKVHAVQYMSVPTYPWRRLREEKPGQYEKPIEPAPDGDAWVHARVVVEARKVSVFVNNATKPSLVADELSERTAGSVGLWGFHFGMIANLKISPSDK